MELRPIKELTDDELVETSGSLIEGTPSGLRAQYAQAELTRRLMETIRNADKNTTRYSRVMLIFTATLFVVSLMQLMAAIYGPYDGKWFPAIAFTVVIAIIYGAGRRFEKEIF